MSSSAAPPAGAPPPPAPRPAPARRLFVVPWCDPRLDDAGHDPRSPYVEQFWLGILGPSATWLLRRLANEFDAAPDGFVLDVADMARSLGLGLGTSNGGPVVKTIERCAQFGLIRFDRDAETLAARRRLPSLTTGQVARLSTALQLAHREYVHAARRRAHARPDPPGATAS